MSSNDSDDFYEKMKEIHASQHQREEKRLKLEEKLNFYLNSDNRLIYLKAQKLQNYWKEICQQDRLSRIRNETLLRDMEKLEAHLEAMTACTNRLKSLKRQYNEYLKTQYPSWKESPQVLLQDKANVTNAIHVVDDRFQNLKVRDDKRIVKSFPDISFPQNHLYHQSPELSQKPPSSKRQYDEARGDYHRRKSLHNENSDKPPLSSSGKSNAYSEDGDSYFLFSQQNYIPKAKSRCQQEISESKDNFFSISKTLYVSPDHIKYKFFNQQAKDKLKIKKINLVQNEKTSSHNSESDGNTLNAGITPKANTMGIRQSDGYDRAYVYHCRSMKKHDFVEDCQKHVDDISEQEKNISDGNIQYVSQNLNTLPQSNFQKKNENMVLFSSVELKKPSPFVSESSIETIEINQFTSRPCVRFADLPQTNSNISQPIDSSSKVLFLASDGKESENSFQNSVFPNPSHPVKKSADIPLLDQWSKTIFADSLDKQQHRKEKIPAQINQLITDSPDEEMLENYDNKSKNGSTFESNESEFYEGAKNIHNKSETIIMSKSQPNQKNYKISKRSHNISQKSTVEDLVNEVEESASADITTVKTSSQEHSNVIYLSDTKNQYSSESLSQLRTKIEPDANKVEVIDLKTSDSNKFESEADINSIDSRQSKKPYIKEKVKDYFSSDDSDGSLSPTDMQKDSEKNLSYADPSEDEDSRGTIDEGKKQHFKDIDKTEKPHDSEREKEDTSSSLNQEGLFKLLKTVEDYLSDSDAKDTLYKSSSNSSVEVIEHIVKAANSTASVTEYEDAVSTAILSQLPGFIQQLPGGCLFSEILLQQFNVHFTPPDIKNYIIPSNRLLWDQLLNHFDVLIKHKAFTPKQLACIFGPLLIPSDSSDFEKKKAELILRTIFTFSEDDSSDSSSSAEASFSQRKREIEKQSSKDSKPNKKQIFHHSSESISEASLILPTDKEEINSKKEETKNVKKISIDSDSGDDSFFDKVTVPLSATQAYQTLLNKSKSEQVHNDFDDNMDEFDIEDELTSAVSRQSVTSRSKDF